MKRDWNVVREILIAIEESIPGIYLRLTNFDQSREHEISYHVIILEEAKLIDATIPKSLGNGPINFMINRLTWSGQELLDAIRSEKIWHKITELFKQQTIAMTYELVLLVAIHFAKQALISNYTHVT